MSRQIRGQHIDEYVAAHQDASRNAHARSLEAAFAAWQEDLRSDQSRFEAEKIMTLGLMVQPFMICSAIFHFPLLSMQYTA